MVTKLVFETATLADSVRKAFACSPKKGAAFDKAAGIVFEFNATDSETFHVRSTNLDVYYTEWVDLVTCEGLDKTIQWRFNAALLNGVINSLPIGSGKQVIFEDKDDSNKVVNVTSGRTKCKMNLINTDHYPVWYPFDPDDLIKAPDFGGRMAQVEWAVDKSHEIMSGVHFDGEYVYATDSYKLAIASFEFGLTTPVTLPAGIMSSILKKSNEIMVGATENQFLIMPDEHTQIRTVIYAGKYPNVKRIMDQVKPNQIEFDRRPLVEMIGRALNFVGSDRFPTLRMFIGAEEIAVMISNEEMGMLGDVLEVSGQATHGRIEILISPDSIMEALNRGPNEKVVLHYNPGNLKEILMIEGGSGYRAWIQPRNPKKEGSE